MSQIGIEYVAGVTEALPDESRIAGLSLSFPADM